MSNTVPNKIVLDRSTKVSLNDRFTKFTKERLQQRKQNVKLGPKKIVGNVSTKVGLKFAKVASTKNRRLAQQMANRPSVQAALRLKKRSFRQRFGGVRVGVGISRKPRIGAAKRLVRGATIKARLNRSINNQPTSDIKSRLSGRKTIGNRLNTSTSTIINRRTNAGQRLNKNIQRRNALNASGKFTDLKSSLKTHFKGQGNRQGLNKPTGPGRLNGRIRAKTQRIRGGLTRGGRRNRGNGKQQQQQQKNQSTATKESLDKDLDQYMLKTKSRLDSDLDAYMAQN